jgi:hypothetical protein
VRWWQRQYFFGSKVFGLVSFASASASVVGFHLVSLLGGAGICSCQRSVDTDTNTMLCCVVKEKKL